MKLALFVAAALYATVCITPASAQDLDQANFNNALITRSQIIHNTGGALDPLSVRSRYVKRNRALRSRRYSNTRRFRTSRYRTSRFTGNTRRAPVRYRTYRTTRSTNYQSRR